MKKRLSICIILVLVLFLLIYPADSLNATVRGLLLWYEDVLPALLPFTILSNILVTSGYLDEMVGLAQPILNKLFFGHPHAAYPVLAGFLFGFPMGSKASADLLRKGSLSKREADILCAMCNQISPAFVSSFLLMASLGLPHMAVQTYLILYAPPFLAGMFLLWKTPHRSHTILAADDSTQKTASEACISFQIIDAGILNGFEIMLKLGGYIILFSLLAQMCMRCFGRHRLLFLCFNGVAEITNGIQQIAQSPYPMAIRYPWLLGITAFGGLSGLAQTASMTKGTPVSMWFYLRFRLFTAALTALLAYVIIQ